MDVQALTLSRPYLDLNQMRAHLVSTGGGRDRVFDLLNLARGNGTDFSAKILIKPSAISPTRHTMISNMTNAGMRGFTIETGA